jgi:hypothetical protein
MTRESAQEIVRRLPGDKLDPERRPRTWDVEVTAATLWPAGTAAGSREAAEFPEPSLLPRTRHLVRDFPVENLEQPYLTHLRQRVSRDPRDLTSHVRRVLELRELHDGEGTYGALVDLFLVLGSGGRRLRTRLLRRTADLLDPGQVEFLSARLVTGLAADDPAGSAPGSRLSRRVAGTTRIVARTGGENPGPIELARESMACGRGDVARVLLEGTLDADPGNNEVSDALLDLYETSADREHFFRTYSALLGRKLARADRWSRLAADFRATPRSGD